VRQWLSVSKRRAEPSDSSKPTPATADGLLRVDEQTRRAYLGDIEVVLRVREFDLLSRFLASPGAALSRATLMADAWDPQWFGSPKTLDVRVSSLRCKLQAAAALAEVGAPAIAAMTGVRVPLRERHDDRDVGTQ
jgi:DNA-binding response OmpR family regulator